MCESVPRVRASLWRGATGGASTTTTGKKEQPAATFARLFGRSYVGRGVPRIIRLRFSRVSV